MESILAGLAMVVVGLVGAFFGYRLFRILLPLYGAVFGFLVAWGWWGEQAWLLALVAGVLFAVILAFLAYWIWSAFITLAGVILGLGLGAIIGTSLNLWSWLTGLIAIALGALFGFLFMRYRNVMVIISTGLTGAATVARGVGEFFGLSGGFSGSLPGTLLVIVMLVVFAVVAVLGIAFQLRKYRALNWYAGEKAPKAPAPAAATPAPQPVPAATRGATFGSIDAAAGGAGAGAVAAGAVAVAGVAVAAEAANEETPSVAAAEAAVADASVEAEAVAAEVTEESEEVAAAAAEAPEAAAAGMEEAGAVAVVEEASEPVAAQVSEAGEAVVEVVEGAPEAASEAAGGGLAAGVAAAAALGAVDNKSGEEIPAEAENVVEDAIKAIEETFPLEDIAKFKEKLQFVEGIGPAFAEKLEAVGINSVLDLLRRGATRKGRQELVEATGITGKLILKWVNHADLYRIKGVGSEYADLLEASGVDTVVELAHRNPTNLYNSVVETNKVKNLVRKEPVASQVEDWVEQAKKLPRMIQY